MNVLGRYPFHIHLNGAGINSQNSYYNDNSLVDNNFRCITVHGTNHSHLERNVAYNTKGHCYYLEDGVEEYNYFLYNLAAHVHPIKIPANGDGGQGGETFLNSADLVLPADTSAAGFYISNAANYFRGNAASGGWTGFAFPNIPYPLGFFKDKDYGSNNPMQRPFLEFDGNTAHSSGWYWEAHGSPFLQSLSPSLSLSLLLQINRFLHVCRSMAHPHNWRRFKL